MSSVTIETSLFDFLHDLKENNHRDWFNDHKDRYVRAHERMIAFAEALMGRMSAHDHLVPMSGKQSLFRIYRDIRFSKDKTPYKTHFSGRMKRATKWLRGGYYYHIEPGASIIAGGFWGPNSADLKRIRQELAADAHLLRDIIADPTFVETFGELKGQQLKTAPLGFSRDHPNIDLLRYKQFLMIRNFSDREVMSDHFLDEAVQTYLNMRPLFDYMSEVLTTDENGVPLED